MVAYIHADTYSEVLGSSRWFLPASVQWCDLFSFASVTRRKLFHQPKVRAQSPCRPECCPTLFCMACTCGQRLVWSWTWCDEGHAALGASASQGCWSGHSICARNRDDSSAFLRSMLSERVQKELVEPTVDEARKHSCFKATTTPWMPSRLYLTKLEELSVKYSDSSMRVNLPSCPYHLCGHPVLNLTCCSGVFAQRQGA